MEEHNYFAFSQILSRDLLLSYRNQIDTIYPVIFFALIILLFAVGMHLDSELLQLAGPGIIWLAALLAHILALERLFHHDFADGSLEQLLLRPQLLAILVAAKLFAHWMVTAMPLILLTPLFALIIKLSFAQMLVLLLTLLVGTPIVTMIGAIMAALTVGLRGRGLLLPLLALPLYIPIFIFAIGSVDAVGTELSVSGLMAFLLAMLLLAITFSPLVIAAALRVGVNE